MTWAKRYRALLFVLVVTIPTMGISAEKLSKEEVDWLISEVGIPPAQETDETNQADSNLLEKGTSILAQESPQESKEMDEEDAITPEEARLVLEAEVNRPHNNVQQHAPKGSFFRGLPQVVKSAMKKAKVDLNGMGAYVLRIGDKKPMLTFHENNAQSPASVMKLVTTYAALGTLGADYRWPTEMYMTGHIKKRTLNGNLVIKGYGSPDFDTADLRKMLRKLRNKGIRHLNGKIVFDTSYFKPSKVNPGAFDGKRYQAYNAQPDALLFNEKTSQYVVRNVRGKARVYTSTPAKNVRIVNRIRTVKSRCRGRARNPRMRVTSSSKGHVVTFSGRFSKRCGKRTYRLAITDSSNMIYSSIKRYWKRDVGGRIKKARFSRGVTPTNAKLLHRHMSAPLSKIIKKVNKKSNNLMARQLMLTIGAEELSAPSTPKKSEKAIKRWLQSQGLRFPELRIENGSGLSRWSSITTRHIGELLLHAYNSPYKRYLVDSLAVAGKDGTVKRRFRNTPVAGRGHFKTGSLRDARAIAGFVRGADGKDYIVAILHSGKAARRRAKRAHDALIQWVYWRGKTG